MTAALLEKSDYNFHRGIYMISDTLDAPTLEKLRADLKASREKLCQHVYDKIISFTDACCSKKAELQKKAEILATASVELSGLREQMAHQGGIVETHSYPAGGNEAIIVRGVRERAQDAIKNLKPKITEKETLCAELNGAIYGIRESIPEVCGNIKSTTSLLKLLCLE